MKLIKRLYEFKDTEYHLIEKGFGFCKETFLTEPSTNSILGCNVIYKCKNDQDYRECVSSFISADKVNVYSISSDEYNKYLALIKSGKL